jgi:DNA-binding transcriptional LysR family regulator
MLTVNYLSLRYFLETAQCLNISQAANNLHISQPGLSKQIMLLEKELGIKLFERSTRKISLTEEGEYLYKNILPSFNNIGKAVDDLKEAGTIPQKKIRIAAVSSAASNFVPKLIIKLKGKHPNLEFTVKETTSVDSIELVQKNEYDLAFIRTPINLKQAIPKPLKCMEFSKHPLLIAVSSHHPAADNDDIDLYELKDEMFIHYSQKNAPTLYYMLEYACLSAGFIPKTIGEGPEFLTKVNLISNGIGITILPEDIFELINYYHKIKGIHFKNFSLKSSISVVWNSMTVSLITKDALDVLEDIKYSSHTVE